MQHVFSLTFIKKVKEQMNHREIKALPEQIAFNLIMAATRRHCSARNLSLFKYRSREVFDYSLCATRSSTTFTLSF